MNRHRDDLALVIDSADFRRDSHVRARQPGLAEDLDSVIVRPTIVLQDRRYERRVEAAASALALQAAKLHALLAEPLTCPLGSMQTPHCFTGEDGITLVQSKKVGVPYEPASLFNTLRTAEPRAAMCDALPTTEPVRYDAERRFAGAQNVRAQRALESDSHRGLREMREQVHPGLASMEAAAASDKASPQVAVKNTRRGSASRDRELGNATQQSLHGVQSRERGSIAADFMGRDAQPRTAAARPHRVARGRNDAHDRTRTATVQPGHAGSAPRARSEGLTDARNALRSAYAASKLRLPNAPPRSSARNAGVVDGWERLSDPRTKRSQPQRPRAVWPWAAGLALSSMLFAYALTLTVVPESDVVAPPQAIASVAVRANLAQPPGLTEPPSPSTTTAHQRPLAVAGTKAPKPPTRPMARAECREHAAQTK